MSERTIPTPALDLRTPWAITPDALRTVAETATADTERLQALMARAGRPLEGARGVRMRDGVAVIPVSGPLFAEESFWSWIFGGASTPTVARALTTAVDDPSVASIVLEIDSPGGEVAGIGELAALVHEANATKAVTAYISDFGASAAYWIAAAASEVVIAATAQVGSIGAVMTVRDPTASGRAATTIEFVSSQSPDKRPDPTTDHGAALLQERVDAIAAVFINDVATYRAVSRQTVLDDFGGGKLFVGQGAVDAGLADRVDTLEHVLAQQATTLRPLASGGPALPLYQRGRFDRDPQFAGETDDMAEKTQAEQTHATPPSAATDPAILARLAELEKANAALAAKNDAQAEQTKTQAAIVAALREENLTQRAAAATEKLIISGHILPADADGVKAALLQAGRDDAERPVASADGAAPSRFSQVSALIEARPPHGLTNETLKAGAEGYSTVGNAVSGVSGRAKAEADAEDAATMARAYGTKANKRT